MKLPSNEVLTEVQPEKVVPPWQLPEPVPVPGWLQVVSEKLNNYLNSDITFSFQKYD